MDNMPVGWEQPQEDEFAMLLTCFHSLYLGITFPRQEARYSRYLTFRGVPKREIVEWKRALLGFMRKLTYKYGRALVLKSPPHTARIRLLLEMFPQARFVHIHRNPYTVYRSTQHYFDTAIWYTYLQRPDRDLVDRGIVDRYTTLYDAFFEERPLIPPGNYHEMSFEDLEREPLAEMRRLYETLSLPGFDNVVPKLHTYVASLKDYKKNAFPEIPRGERDTVATAWKRSFEEWKYSV
jgi:hypothetical protein